MFRNGENFDCRTWLLRKLDQVGSTCSIAIYDSFQALFLPLASFQSTAAIRCFDIQKSRRIVEAEYLLHQKNQDLDRSRHSSCTSCRRCRSKTGKIPQRSGQLNSGMPVKKQRRDFCRLGTMFSPLPAIWGLRSTSSFFACETSGAASGPPAVELTTRTKRKRGRV